MAGRRHDECLHLLAALLAGDCDDGAFLDRRVRVVSQPAAAFGAGQRLLAPIAPSLAGVMALSRLIATSETDWDTADTARRLGLGTLRTVEEVLREKAALPPIR